MQKYDLSPKLMSPSSPFSKRKDHGIIGFQGFEASRSTSFLPTSKIALCSVNQFVEAIVVSCCQSSVHPLSTLLISPTQMNV
mmetsp:Transcript_34637/g.84271  ORF Transcript_34637/g.84271 Transcript_34637/m.84271 type:complete len:82 (+) Transcript_34637:640-885(+)